MIRRIIAASLVGLLALTGCARDDGEGAASGGSEARTVTPDRRSEAPRPSRDAFALLAVASDADADQPTLCLTFTRALDPQADYGPYVASEAKLALSVAGQRLCAAGLTYGQSAMVTLRAGLPSADGAKLPADEIVTLAFDDRPPLVAFAGEGVVLPRVGADGLAVRTVNVEAVTVRIERVDDRALAFRSLVSGQRTARDEWDYLPEEETPGAIGIPVFEGEADTDGPRNALVTTVLPITEAVGALAPGAYHVTIEEAAAEGARRPARANRWLIVTDLALTAYRGEGLTVTARSLETARPVGGVRVELIARSNEVLARERTDGSGHVRFPAPLTRGERGNAPRLLAAYGPDGDFAVLDLARAPVDLSGQDVAGRVRPNGADAYLATERGIYRPGETVHATLLLRDHQGGALGDRAGSVTLIAPNGLEQAVRRFDGLPEAGGGSFAFDLPRAAARGVWRLSVRLDGGDEVGSARINVEDFVPQRTALTLRAGDGVLRPGETRMIEARVRFLYGAPGTGLPVTARARIQPDPRPFPQHGGFLFGLADERFAETVSALPRTTTDGEGTARLPFTPGEQTTSLPLRARVVVEASEPGGRAVADDLRLPLRTRDVYVGLRPGFEGRADRNEPVRFHALSVDAAGRPVRVELGWRLVRIDVDYDWYREAGGRWRWRRSERAVPMESGVLPGAAGPVAIQTRPLDWGDYRLIVSAGGEDLASQPFWVGWGGRTASGEAPPDEVRVSAPEGPLSPGDEAEIAILPPYAGLAEVVVATDRVLSVTQVEAPEGGAVVRVPVTADWGAGAYAMVTVYTPRDPGTQPQPRRAVGVAYLATDRDARTLEPTLALPGLARPNEPLRVGLTVLGARARQRVFATVAAVDEGVLLLTDYASPDPAAHLLAKPTLGIALHDDYGRVLDPNQGAAAAMRSGGDTIGGAGLSVVPTETVALFTGPVSLGRDGTGTVTLDVPDFNGELRVMAIVWSAEAVGGAAAPVTVRDDVPTELILPRFLAPGDEASATASLDNVAGAAGDYAVGLSADGGAVRVGDPFDIALTAGERADQPVALQGLAAGVSAITIEATGPDGARVASTYGLEVRSPYLPVTRTERRLLPPGESFTPDPALAAGLTPGSAAVAITAASTPLDARALFAALSRYPYGCTEQTVSRALPLLYEADLAAMTGGAATGQTRVREAIETILARQSPDGAFGLWRVGDRDASPWLGAYTTDFLTRAAGRGHPVPRAATERALDALRPIASGELFRVSGYETRPPNPALGGDTLERSRLRASAYAAYVLAREGRADAGRLRYLHDELLARIDAPLARAQLGAGLAAIGDRTRARSAFRAAVDALGFENAGDYYQTPRRDLAGVLALAQEAGLPELTAGLAERAARALPEPSALSTQELAFLTLAATTIPSEAVSVAGLAADGRLIADGHTVANTGEVPAFVTVLVTGSPTDAPPPASERLRAEKALLAPDGRPVAGPLRRGDRVVVALDVTPERQAEAMYVLADLLPAGLEIEAVLRPEDAGETGPYGFLGTLDRADVAEARDDRFVASVEGRGGRTYSFAYLARAVTPGEFALPALVAEDMYREDVFARTRAGRLTIEP